MPVPRYPLLFPYPQRDSFSYGVDAGVQRTQMRTDRPRQRRAYKSMPHYFNLEFIVPVEMLFRWQSWINGNAYRWFELPVVSAATANMPTCTSYSVVKFTGDLTVVVLTKDNLRVTVNAELAPGQLEL